jgi:SNF2 family DNA or RNA helicase
MARPANSSSTKSTKSIDPAALAQLLLTHTKPLNWYEQLSDEQQEVTDLAISAMMQWGGAGLLADPGTGKTIVSMAIIQHFLPKNLLIVAPLTSLETTWAKRLRNLYREITNTVDEYKGGVLLIGYEQFRSKKAITRIVRKFKFDLAIFDESQGLKHRASKQSAAVKRLRMRVPLRLILSGTPIDESPIDLWAQMRFIAPQCLGDVWAPPRDRRKYEGPYFEEDFLRKCGFMGYQREFIADRMPEFLKRVSPFLFRLTNDLEPAELIPVKVNILGQQRKILDQMEAHGIVHIDGKKTKAGLKPIRDLRCFQIIGGFLTMDDGTSICVGQAKQRKLAWLIKHLERPVVFCRFLPELEEIGSILKQEFKKVALLSGAIKDKKNDKARTRMIDDFQAHKIDALGVQERTGGTSIEFTASHELVFYSMGFSYITFQQIIARLRRHGQEKRVKVYLLIGQDTIDEIPLERVMTKGETVEPIMKHIKERSMAEAKKAAKKTAPKKAAKKEATKGEIGVDYIADKLDISESAARKRLRDFNIPKNGGSYNWATKADADKVVKKVDVVKKED